MTPWRTTEVASLRAGDALRVAAITGRSPRGRNGLSWGRVLLANETVLSYRLFRRDSRGRTHGLFLAFVRDDSRSEIARQLRHAKRQLRDEVDAIDLQLMEAA